MEKKLSIKKHGPLLLAILVVTVGAGVALTGLPQFDSDVEPEATVVPSAIPHDHDDGAAPAPSPQGASKTAPEKKPFVRSGRGQLPAISTPEDLGALRARADRGDAEAAYRVANELYECSLLDNQFQRLEARVKTAEIGIPAADRQMQRLELKFTKCRGLNQADFEQRFDYVEKAALAGNLDAQVDYVTLYGERLSDPTYALDPEWLRSYKDRSLGFLKAAGSRGSVDAMSTLAHVYWDGLIVEQSRVLAYANMHAAMRSGLAGSAQAVLNVWESSMTAEEVTHGRNLGNKIYAQCCEY